MVRALVFAVLILLASCVVAHAACVALQDDDVHATQHGFVILPLLEYFPFQNTNKSGDDRFWLCWRDDGSGELALFAPPADLEDEGSNGR